MHDNTSNARLGLAKGSVRGLELPHQRQRNEDIGGRATHYRSLMSIPGHQKKARVVRTKPDTKTDESISGARVVQWSTYVTVLMFALRSANALFCVTVIPLAMAPAGQRRSAHADYKFLISRRTQCRACAKRQKWGDEPVLRPGHIGMRSRRRSAKGGRTNSRSGRPRRFGQ